jgi:Bifunctional DNA primase/polymerase, N-terminal
VTGSRQAQTLAAASGYIATGWKVFVLSPSKKPVALCDFCRDRHVTPEQMEACGCLTCHGFYAATADPGCAFAMIARHPRGLLAIRTGAESGLAVLDVDAPAGLVTMRRLIRDGLMPRTVSQQTGGGGYHMLYRHPGGRIPSVPGGAGDHVDVKADGGYIVAWPSVHPDTRQPYRWLSPFDGPITALPEAWPARLSPPPAPVMLPPVPVGSPGAYAAAVLDGETSRAAAAVNGQRNHELNRAAFALFRHVAGGTLDEETVSGRLWQAAAVTGLAAEDPGSVRRTIASARRAGIRSPRSRC